MMKENLYFAKEKMELLLNIEETDKSKFEGLYAWCPRAMELTVKEKMSTLIPEMGEIWTIDFGVNVGAEIDKIRPGVITSRWLNNKNSKVVSVAPITHTNQSFDTHVIIEDKLLQYKEDNIDGTIKLEQERSVSKSRLGRKIGKLNDQGILALQRAVLIHHDVDVASLMKYMEEVGPKEVKEVKEVKK